MPASTEKIVPPGLIPGKDEGEKYRKLYQDGDFTLVDKIRSFDSSVLSENRL